MTDIEIWWSAFLAALASGCDPSGSWNRANAALRLYREKRIELEREE